MKRITIVYGEYSGIQKKAIDHLTEIIVDYTDEYPACIDSDEFMREEDMRYIFVGTKENNAYIKEKSDRELYHKEAYYIKVQDDEVMIEGSDDGGVLYGCIDFYNKYIIKHENTHSNAPYFKNIFELSLPEDSIFSYPAVRERGLWTWGHVIYDYKGYIDHLVKCKLNSIIIWNDFIPVNVHELVEYAHECNVKVIWGFAWLWDTKCADVDLSNLDEQVNNIVEKYEREYAHLEGDGIYFQSFTEVDTDTIGDVLIADAVTKFVNMTAEILFQKYPDLVLQFGLHSTSVNNRLSYIKNVNPKIRIVWEDGKSFPMNYIPQKVEYYQETRDFMEKILTLRGEKDRFGVILKGFTNLDWPSFVHQHGRYVMGVSTKQTKAEKIERKRKIWKYIQAYWLSNADKAYDMVKLMQQIKEGDLYITALVEDGMFEENIYYPVALYAEMLWDCDSDIKTLMTDVALRRNVEFA